MIKEGDSSLREYNKKGYLSPILTEKEYLCFKRKITFIKK